MKPKENNTVVFFFLGYKTMYQLRDKILLQITRWRKYKSVKI
jgi:hypothetical protein